MKNNSDNRINVDKANYSVVASFKQEDDAILTVELFKNGVEFNVSEQEISLAAIREDKVIIEQIDGFSIDTNRVTIELKKNILAVPGTVLCELNLLDTHGSMTTTDFKIKVNKKILTVDSINANDLETINNIKREELKRQKNETERKLNEETRKTQEEDRKINDKARQSQEVARQEAELLRETQEFKRQENELLREEMFNNSQQERDSKFIDAQNDRENTFNLNERERKNTFTSNEQDRTNVFNTNELTRNENEETRKSQENERVNAENIRKSNEEIRTSNEIDRENRFDIVEANANSLIGEMQNTIDSNIGTEVIEARKDKAKLGLRLDDMETQSSQNTNRIEQLEDLTPVWQEHEGTGSVTVNDSFDGVTKDLVVKGQTLQNLSELPSVVELGYSAVRQNGHMIKLNVPFTYMFTIGNYTGDVDEGGYVFEAVYADGTYKRIYDVATEQGGWSRDKGKTIKILYTHSKEVVRFESWNRNSSGSVEILNPLILEGDWTNKPIPSHFDSITSAGELENNKIKLKSVGKNLINFEQVHSKLCVIDKDNKTIIGTEGYNDVQFYVHLVKNCKYRFSGIGSFAVAFDILKGKQTGYVADKLIQKVNNHSSQFFIYTGETGVQTIHVPNFRGESKDFQLEENTVATNYEQFRSKLIEILLPFQKGLKSTLDGAIFDEINGNTGEIIQRVSDEYTALSKPIIHKIDDIQLNTFDERTHIMQENNILSDISFKAKVSLSSQSKRLSEENKALKEENRELREDTNVIVDSLISVFEPMMLPNENTGEEQRIILEKLYAIKNR